MRRLTLLLVSVASLVVGLTTAAAGEADGQHAARVVSGLGVTEIAGEDVVVHVLAVVPQGERPGTVLAQSLRAQHARPFQSADYSRSGLFWDEFGDTVGTNDFVTQYYNPANAPVASGGAVTAAQATWTDVGSSSFAFLDGGDTSRCPSLVTECGSQHFDGFNDVGWIEIRDGNTLGVTWWGTSEDEADMALSTRFRWTTEASQEGRISGCKGPSRNCYVFDVETVKLHEDGHVAGLGHSAVDGAVMEAAYEQVRRSLHADDIAGISALYPAGPTNTAPGVTITSPTDGQAFASGASIDFAGSASDPEDGDLTADLSWTSSIDGALGAGGNFSRVLSDGTHVVSASVTDSDGATGSTSITITVGSPPSATVVPSIESYAAFGGKAADQHLDITIRLTDAVTGNGVVGTVTITVYRNDGSIWSGSRSTDSAGWVTFGFRGIGPGCYATDVTDVTAAGYTWDGSEVVTSFSNSGATCAPR